MSTENLRKIVRLRKIGEGVLTLEVLTKVGEAYEVIVRNRTRQGRDLHGKTFKPYSPGYKRIRERAGEPTHPVNLTMDHFTGMLASIDHTVFNDMSGVQAYIEGDSKAQIARYHAIEGAGKSKVIREFWGLSDEESNKIRDLIETELDKILNDTL